MKELIKTSYFFENKKDIPIQWNRTLSLKYSWNGLALNIVTPIKKVEYFGERFSLFQRINKFLRKTFKSHLFLKHLRRVRDDYDKH